MPDPQMIEVNADALRRVLDEWPDQRTTSNDLATAAMRLRAALPEPEPPITVGCRVRDGYGNEATVLALDGGDAWCRFRVYRAAVRLSTLTYVGPGDPPPAPIPAEAQAVIDAALAVMEPAGIGSDRRWTRFCDAVRAYREVQDRG